MSNAYYNAPAPAQKNPVQALKDRASAPAMQKRFAEVLGSDSVAKQFLAGVIGAVNTNKQLKDADPDSVLSSAMVAATLNLSCVPSLGQAALVPYKNNGKMYAQFQVMTRGLIQLAQRTGQYRNINAGDVYEDELIGRNMLTGEIEFQSIEGGYRDQGQEDKIIGYFAYIETVTGFKKTEFWTKDEVIHHRNKIAKSQNGPWSTNFNAMARKTVLKSLLNHYGPMSVDSQLATAIEDDQKVYNSNGEGEYLDNPTRDIDADVFDAPQADNASYVEPQQPVQEQPVAQQYANGPETFFDDDIPGFSRN